MTTAQWVGFGVMMSYWIGVFLFLRYQAEKRRKECAEIIERIKRRGHTVMFF